VRWKLLIICLSWPVLHAQTTFDLQGHRGARGLAPENTFPAFIAALQQGVTTLELDVVITKDWQVLVSHDPWINSRFCKDSRGRKIRRMAPIRHNIYRMTYEKVRTYDCGTTPHPRFPGQALQPAHKPLLREVIPEIQDYIATHQLPAVSFNIEIKSFRFGDDIFHPSPDIFADLLVAELKKLGILEQTTIQSFDIRPLKYLHKQYPGVRLSLLIEGNKGIEKRLHRLGFLPDIYSPAFRLVDSSLVQAVHQKGMLLIPWTVNRKEDILQLLEWGVDGVITDYPDIARSLIDLLFEH